LNASVRDAAAKTFTVCGLQGSLRTAAGFGTSVGIAVGVGFGEAHAEKIRMAAISKVGMKYAFFGEIMSISLNLDYLDYGETSNAF
jgi:hypothetical protein